MVVETAIRDGTPDFRLPQLLLHGDFVGCGDWQRDYNMTPDGRFLMRVRIGG